MTQDRKLNTKPPRTAAKRSRGKVAARTSVSSPQANTHTAIRECDHSNGEGRRNLIAQAAYFRAERRGFIPGNELDDWLAAEAEVAGTIDRQAASDARHP